MACTYMADYLDIATWPRRDAFEFFRRFDKPYFNVCTRLDVARLKAALPTGTGLSLACYFIALRLANENTPFRFRIEGDRVRVHEVVHGSTTVLRDDGESFSFAEFDHETDFAVFAAEARAAIDAARTMRASFDPRPDDVARVYFTSLPWLNFTSFSHARIWGREDSIPRFALGRAEPDGERLWLPLSIEVHHALMDGVHVGRYVQDFEAVLREPASFLAAKA